MNSLQKIRQHLNILVLSFFALACSQVKEEQALALALQQELEFINKPIKPNHQGWYNWQLQTLGKASREFNYFKPLDSAFNKIESVVGKMKFIEEKIKSRYQEDTSDKIKLTAEEEAKLIEIKALLEKDINEFRKLIFINNEYIHTAKLQHLMPVWFKKEQHKIWINMYFQNKPAYSVLLQFEVFKTMFYTHYKALKDQTISYLRMGANSYFPKISLFASSIKDTLRAGESGKGIFYLSFNHYPSFPYYESPFPKAFILNGKEMPIFKDSVSGEPVVHITFPTITANLKGQDAVPREWSGKWIVSLSEFKDTTIYVKGKYIINK
jgi:hypothetical protein